MTMRAFALFLALLLLPIGAFAQVCGPTSPQYCGNPGVSGLYVGGAVGSVNGLGSLTGTWGGTPVWTGFHNFPAGASIVGGNLGGTFTGAPTFSGTPTFSGAVTLNGGGTLNGTFSGTGNVGTLTATANSVTNSLATWFTATANCTPIDAYGGNSGGSVDNTSAWAAAIAAQRYSTNVCVQFGSGTYYFASAISATAATLGSVMVLGNGTDATALKFASGQNGLTITYADWSSSATVQNLTIAAMGSNVGSTVGLNLTTTAGFVANQNAQSNIFNVTLRGSDGYARTNLWHTGVQIFGVRWVNVTNLMVQGGGSSGGCTGCINNGSIGLNYAGTSTAIPVQLNIQGSHFDYVTYGIEYGTYAQGLVVNMCDVVGGVYGIYTPAANVGNDQLTVSNSNFNVGDQNGVTSGITGFGIFDGVGVTNTQVVGNTFLVEPNSYGYSALSAQMLAISGNTFQQINDNNTQSGGGVVITANTLPVSITGNTFDYLPNPIWLKAGTNNVQVSGNNSFYNSYGSPPQNILDQGTNNVTQFNCGGGISNNPTCLTDTGTHTYGINQTGATISKFSLVSPSVLALGSTTDPRVMLGGSAGGIDGNGALLLGSIAGTTGLSPYVDFHSQGAALADFRIQANATANTGMFYVGNGSGYTQVAQMSATATTVYEPLILPGYAIASLPACGAGLKGANAYVTNGVASPTYLGAVSTTGAANDRVFCNGSGWVYD